MSEKTIAVCGIDCTHCPLLKASLGDAQAAEHLAGWWKSEGWLKEDEGAAEILERGPHCLGCRGDRSTHWSADCQILKCCVDDKGLASCHQCDDFACEQLVEWAAQNDGYTEALNRLRDMKESAA
jgi:uncharacterized protein DUF3795